METLKSEFVDVNTKCKFLVDMVPGGKPYSDRFTGEICVGSPGRTQGLWRYALGECKETCISYTNLAIIQLQQYLDHYIEYVRWHSVTDEVHTLYSEIAELVTDVNAGLQHLNDTYDSDEEIVAIKDGYTRSLDMFSKGCIRFAAIGSTLVVANAVSPSEQSGTQ
jgi:hypothetical protein